MSIYLTPQMLNPDFQSRETGERFGFFRRLSQSVVRKWRRRKMIAAFEALDDRLLRDIGVFRGDIKHLVDGFDDRELRMVPLAPAQTTTWLEGEALKKAV
tara:strand:- start:18232 stop:18531 length:300 start_codon:yes stop_codon:yes gene_type:complete